MPELADWNSFYVIVGSSAGALIGLQFVVLTLIAQRPYARGEEASAAFSTPSVVHFAVVLLLSAILSAPWHAITTVSVIWGVVGAAGAAYSVVVARRMKVQKVYRPVFEDWLFHVLLPLSAYVLLVIAGLVALSAKARSALFVVGAATLVFLFVGIHNSWDAVTYYVFTNLPNQRKSDKDG